MIAASYLNAFEIIDILRWAICQAREIILVLRVHPFLNFFNLYTSIFKFEYQILKIFKVLLININKSSINYLLHMLNISNLMSPQTETPEFISTAIEMLSFTRVRPLIPSPIISRSSKFKFYTSFVIFCPKSFSSRVGPPNNCCTLNNLMLFAVPFNSLGILLRSAIYLKLMLNEKVALIPNNSIHYKSVVF